MGNNPVLGPYEPYSIRYSRYVNNTVYVLLIQLALFAGRWATGAIISYMNGDDAWWDQEFPFPLTFPRFMIHRNMQDLKEYDNAIDDNFTGLTWISDPSALGGVWGELGFPSTMTWYEAIDACNALNYGGHNDWRMPNEKELSTIADFANDHPAINKTYFKNTKDDNYFTGSITNWGCENYYQGDGGTGGKTWDQDKEKKKYCRPVRGKLFPGTKTKNGKDVFFQRHYETRNRHSGI